MMKKVILLLLMVLLLVVSPLIGCSNSNGGVTNPIGLVPKKANVVGHVDLTKILQDNDLAVIYDKVPNKAIMEAVAIRVTVHGKISSSE